MDPIGRPLNAEEMAVLTVLMQEGRASHECTARSVTMVLERDLIDVASVLARLERDGLVAREADPAGEQCWRANLG